MSAIPTSCENTGDDQPNFSGTAMSQVHRKFV